MKKNSQHHAHDTRNIKQALKALAAAQALLEKILARPGT